MIAGGQAGSRCPKYNLLGRLRYPQRLRPDGDGGDLLVSAAALFKQQFGVIPEFEFVKKLFHGFILVRCG